ncbi:MAG: DegT/DnrJ/EryC1/StrS aminotransferase family protein, partial [Phycisphaerales bacterium]|nr:DegT/DnrJ/EryC1/StrS aminotransferase family protein [Phycisphaerales bacterium]
MDSMPLNCPHLPPESYRSVARALRAVSHGDRGPVEKFEQACADVADRSIAVAAGTAGIALEASLLALHLEPGDEVICPALAPARLVSAIARTQGIPVFVDVDARHGSLRSDAVEPAITERTRAIAVTAPCGNPTGFADLAGVSRKYELPIIEDAVESLGARVGEDRAARFGVMAVVGFGIESPVFAAGGAAIVTHDDALAERCREILDEGRVRVQVAEDPSISRGWAFGQVGVDGGLDALRAAVATEVLTDIDSILDRRAEIANAYVRRLGGHPDLFVPTPPNDARPTWPAFPIRLDERFTDDDRDEIIYGLLRHEIGASGGWPLAPGLPAVCKPGMSPDLWPVAHRLSSRTLRLPCHPGLESSEVDLICQTLELM